jgi:hypothetical protein
MTRRERAHEIPEKSPKIRKCSLLKGSQSVTTLSHRRKLPNSREKPAVMPFWEDPKVIAPKFIQGS